MQELGNRAYSNMTSDMPPHIVTTQNLMTRHNYGTESVNSILWNPTMQSAAPSE